MLPVPLGYRWQNMMNAAGKRIYLHGLGLFESRTNGQAWSGPNCAEGIYPILMYGPTECIQMVLNANVLNFDTGCSGMENEYDLMFRSQNGDHPPIPPHRPPIPNFPENGQLGNLGPRV